MGSVDAEFKEDEAAFWIPVTRPGGGRLARSSSREVAASNLIHRDSTRLSQTSQDAIRTS